METFPIDKRWMNQWTIQSLNHKFQEKSIYTQSPVSNTHHYPRTLQPNFSLNYLPKIINRSVLFHGIYPFIKIYSSRKNIFHRKNFLSASPANSCSTTPQIAGNTVLFICNVHNSFPQAADHRSSSSRSHRRAFVRSRIDTLSSQNIPPPPVHPPQKHSLSWRGCQCSGGTCICVFIDHKS